MIQIREVLKQTSKFNAVTIASALIQIPTQILIGIFLLPEEYGVISFVGLWSLYGGLLNPGMLLAACREIPFLIGQNNHGKALKVQNIAISSDIIFSFLPFFIILFSSFFYSNKLIKIGLLLTAIYFMINRLSVYWSSINFAQQKFSIVAIGKLLGVVFPPIFIICSISLVGIYALLIAPIICATSTGLFYWKKGQINYHFEFDWDEVYRLIRIGIIFSLTGLIFYGYKMADSTIIASFLPLSDLGLFSFAMTFILFGINFFLDFSRVLEPILYEESGKKVNNKESFSNTKIMIVYMAFIISVLIPISQVAYGLVVKLYITKYVESISLFMILSNMLYLATVPTIPNIILSSVVINKQKMVTIIYAFGLLINIFMNILMIKMGYGIKAIAFITIGSQSLITLILFILAIEYILNKKENIFNYSLLIVLPLLISVIYSFLNNNIFNNNLNLIRWSMISILFQISTWMILINTLYKDYFKKNDFIDLAREIIGKRS